MSEETENEPCDPKEFIDQLAAGIVQGDIDDIRCATHHIDELESALGKSTLTIALYKYCFQAVLQAACIHFRINENTK